MSTVEASRTRTASRSWMRALVVLLIVIAIDQITKALVRGSLAVGEESRILPGVKLLHAQNKGVAFNFLGNGGAPVIVVTVAALALLFGYFTRNPDRPLLWLPTGLLLGGALGNLFDRVRQGYVTDFITFPHFPSFNVADMAITFGVVVLVLVLERGGRAVGD
jgi:signal peptidase II